MPLASVANLAPILGMAEDKLRRMLGTLHDAGWVASVRRSITERRQHRWFLTRKAVDLLHTTDHQHPSPREEARAAGLAEFHPEGELPGDFAEQFALDHDHPAHLENQYSSPFAIGEPVGDNGASDGPDHEHPPWDRYLAGHRDLTVPPVHAGAGLPPSPGPGAQRTGGQTPQR